MQALSPAIEVYPVHPRPMLKADVDQLGLVSLINHDVPTEMGVEAGTVGADPGVGYAQWPQSAVPPGRVLRPARYCASLGKAVPPQALHDDTAGRGPRSPLRLWHDAALHGLCGPGGRANGLERRSVHCDTPPQCLG